MSENLSPEKVRFLQLVALHLSQRREPPTNAWLQEQLQLSPSGVSETARKLRQEGYLSGGRGVYLLTDRAVSYVDNLNIGIMTEIPIMGEVKAGQAEPDELAVYISSPSEWDGSSLSVIGGLKAVDVYALTVRGRSMEAEHILDGDAVIVKPVNGVSPRGQLVIAKYWDSRERFPSGFGADVPDDELRGPTLKHYYEVAPGQYRLSASRTGAITSIQ